MCHVKLIVYKAKRELLNLRFVYYLSNRTTLPCLTQVLHLHIMLSIFTFSLKKEDYWNEEDWIQDYLLSNSEDEHIKEYIKDVKL